MGFRCGKAVFMLVNRDRSPDPEQIMDEGKSRGSNQDLFRSRLCRNFSSGGP